MKTLYAIPNYECNLNCSHCDIRLKKCEYNRDLFIEQINKFDGQVILFGGEPLLYADRLEDCINTGKISSISTNLLLLDYKRMEYIKDLHISTSWNPERFLYEDYWYEKWLVSLKAFKDNSTVLITLTEDLLEIYPEDFLHRISKWETTGILFEQLIDPSKDKKFYNKVDNWLCRVYEKWNTPIRNLIIDKLNNWNCDCDNVYTLNPDGTIEHKCPHSFDISFCNDCISCDRFDSCRPCRLHQYCTYPKKLAKLVLQK